MREANENNLSSDLSLDITNETDDDLLFVVIKNLLAHNPHWLAHSFVIYDFIQENSTVDFIIHFWLPRPACNVFSEVLKKLQHFTQV